MHKKKTEPYSILSNLYNLTGISYYIYDKHGKFIRKHLSVAHNQNPYLSNIFQRICLELNTKSATRTDLGMSLPVYYYACSSADTIYIIGPVAHADMDSNMLRTYQKLFASNTETLVYCPVNTALSVLSILLSAYCDTELSVNELHELFYDTVIPADSSAPLKEELRQIDAFQLNHSYADEKVFINLLKEGDITQIERVLRQNILLFPMPIQDEHRNLEYMVVTLLAVVSRAAIEGGLPSHDGLLQSDVFLNRIYQCKTNDELYVLGNEIVMTYAKMVHQHHMLETQNLLILKCIKIIHSKLLETISLSSLAQELSVSESHLARCFKAEKGQTVTQYILKKKIELACEILTNFNYSVNEIASFLQFRSTSYFIKVFKRHMDCTPTEFARRTSCACLGLIQTTR